jgi:tetratricopeptide (TPR) repeat protein
VPYAAKLISDWKSVSTFTRNISWIYFYQGDHLRALHWAEESLSATAQTEDELLIAAAKRSLGTVELHLGHFDRSETLLKDVLKTSEKFASDDYGIYSKGLRSMGWASLSMAWQYQGCQGMVSKARTPGRIGSRVRSPSLR